MPETTAFADPALATSIRQWNRTVAARTCDYCGSYVGGGDPCACGPCRTCDGDGVVFVQNPAHGRPSCDWDRDEVECPDCGGAA